jgi:hypothetical protein
MQDLDKTAAVFMTREEASKAIKEALAGTLQRRNRYEFTEHIAQAEQTLRMHAIYAEDPDPVSVFMESQKQQKQLFAATLTWHETGSAFHKAMMASSTRHSDLLEKHSKILEENNRILEKIADAVLAVRDARGEL